MPTLLTFGDSNTYGTLPIQTEGKRDRLNANDRWPCLVRRDLGPDWMLIEEGLPGRTTCHPDIELGPYMDGRVGLFIALESHGPIDFLTLMLGTNDLKTKFDLSPDQIAADLDTLLGIALSDEMQDRHDVFDILLICPAPILEQGEIAEKFIGGATKSLKLANLFGEVAAARHVDFLDAGTVIESSAIDGIHLDKTMHARLAKAVAITLKEMDGI